ncbi:amidohydrolase [Candidatus Woesearchaeota archaeon]|nr:amidohydrolase [Candidatus Woesearchaeota archaeon]
MKPEPNPMILRNCRYLITQNAKRDIFEHMDIEIQDNTIKRIGKNIATKSSDNSGVIDCSERIVMPGLVNTHTHLGMHSLRGICDDAELHDWLSIVTKAEDSLSEDDVHDNTVDGLVEALRFGTTTIYDSFKYPRARARAFEKMGARGLISASVYNKKDLKAAEQFISTIRSPLLRPAIAAHSIYKTEESVLRGVIAVSEDKKILRRIHVGETRKERFDIQQQTEKLPIEYLESIGFLDPKALLVHCIWITKGEIGLIGHAGAKVSHNPISNMKLASGGVMPLVEMLHENVIVGLGTDSVASNNNLDLFEEIKLTPLLHKQHRWDPKVITPQQALDMATVNGAACLGLPDVGSIEAGKKADIVTLDIGKHMKPINNLLSNIVYCANGNDVNDVIIDGKVVMRNKELQKS